MRIKNLASFKNSKRVGLHGQSNCSGFQFPPDLNTYLARKGQYIFNNVTQVWEALQQNHNNGGSFHDYTGSIGCEMKLMELMHEYYGADQYLFKYAEGGTPLAPKVDGELYDWVPGTANAQMYNGCVTNFKNSERLFPAQMPHLDVLIWIQGENDAGGERANDYYQNFHNFITNLKNDLNLPNLKVLQTLLADTQTAYNGPGRDIVNTAKINYSINGNRYVNMDGIEVAADNVHITANGWNNDGAQRIFDVLKTML